MYQYAVDSLFCLMSARFVRVLKAKERGCTISIESQGAGSDEIDGRRLSLCEPSTDDLPPSLTSSFQSGFSASTCTDFL